MAGLPEAVRVRKSALIVAHPGHELRIHGWLESARPVTFVLTQGDGAAGAPRLVSTTAVLSRAGAHIGGVYGALKDREIYAAILERRHDLFVRIVDRLADALVASDIDCVVCDAEEGYNPSHDACRYIAHAAVAMAASTVRHDIEGFDFPLIGAPDLCAADLRSRAVWLRLDEAALGRKLAAAATYLELKHEVDAALAAVGEQAFVTECLRPWAETATDGPARPFYEEYGKRRVASGVYTDLIRLDHLLSLRDTLWRHAGLGG
jgi:hypothetical protein